MDVQHSYGNRHAAWTWTWTCSMDMDMHHGHGHTPWTWELAWAWTLTIFGPTHQAIITYHTSYIVHARRTIVHYTMLDSILMHTVHTFAVPRNPYRKSTPCSVYCRSYAVFRIYNVVQPYIVRQSTLYLCMQQTLGRPTKRLVTVIFLQLYNLSCSVIAKPSDRDATSHGI